MKLVIKTALKSFFHAAKLLLSGGIADTSNSEYITRITESTDGGEGGGRKTTLSSEEVLPLMAAQGSLKSIFALA